MNTSSCWIGFSEHSQDGPLVWICTFQIELSQPPSVQWKWRQIPQRLFAEIVAALSFKSTRPHPVQWWEAFWCTMWKFSNCQVCIISKVMLALVPEFGRDGFRMRITAHDKNRKANLKAARPDQNFPFLPLAYSWSKLSSSDYIFLVFVLSIFLILVFKRLQTVNPILENHSVFA